MSGSFYFMEKYPNEGQLIYVFYSREEKADPTGTYPQLARYVGDGLIVTNTLRIWPIGAGAAWCLAETQNVEPAKIK